MFCCKHFIQFWSRTHLNRMWCCTNYVVFSPIINTMFLAFLRIHKVHAPLWDSAQSFPCIVPILNWTQWRDPRYDLIKKKWGISASVATAHLDRVYLRQLTPLFFFFREVNYIKLYYIFCWVRCSDCRRWNCKLPPISWPLVIALCIPKPVVNVR